MWRKGQAGRSFWFPHIWMCSALDAILAAVHTWGACMFLPCHVTGGKGLWGSELLWLGSVAGPHVVW